MSNLLIIPGSLRESSSSRATARSIIERLGDQVTCVTAEIGKLPHYNADLTDDPQVAEFTSQVTQASGVVFVTPEYNYSVPGVLKNAIDWASRPAYQSPFKDKPCFIVSVSGGALGGVRAQSHLKYILNGMLARPHTCKEIVVTQANTKVKDGKLDDEAVLAFIDQEIAVFLDNIR